MAIYHCSCKTISRNTGRSAVGAAAYRSGEKLFNEYDGMTHDYTKKIGVVYSEIVLPENAPKEYQNREKLWNAVEQKESAKNSRLAREYEIALPVELNRDEQIQLVKDYVKNNFVNCGMCADIAIHDKNDGNPHAHIMLTARPIDTNGMWGERQKKEYILDKNGNKQYDEVKKTYKCRTIKTTNWDDIDFLKERRENWAKTVNEELERKGIAERVDHRSYEDQGIDKIPTRHMGTKTTQMARRGIHTEIGKYNEEVKTLNNDREQLNKMREELQQLREQLKQPVNYIYEEKPLVQTATPVVHQQPAPRSTEQEAERIGKIRSEYISLEIQISQRQNNRNTVSSEVKKLDNDIFRISEITRLINIYERDLNRLREERAKLGIFSGKRKKELDNRIADIEELKTKQTEILQREYNITPDQAFLKARQLQTQIKAINESYSNSMDIDTLLESQRVLEREYRLTMREILARLDASNIMKLEANLCKRNIGSLENRLATATALSKLDNLVQSEKSHAKRREDIEL